MSYQNEIRSPHEMANHLKAAIESDVSIVAGFSAGVIIEHAISVYFGNERASVFSVRDDCGNLNDIGSTWMMVGKTILCEAALMTAKTEETGEVWICRDRETVNAIREMSQLPLSSTEYWLRRACILGAENTLNLFKFEEYHGNLNQ